MKFPDGGAVSRAINLIFPRVPDFRVLLIDQCRLVVQAATVLVEYMETADPGKAEEVRSLEHEGDQLRNRNIDVLNRAFSTPFDREDIYRAITGLDEILNYFKTTVREMEILEVVPNQHMREIALLLRDGVRSLESGFAKLSIDPHGAESDAAIAHKAERKCEKVYRRAVAELFDPHAYLAAGEDEHAERESELTPLLGAMDQKGCSAVSRAITFVLVALKKREVYRHLSNAADRMAGAAEILRDIVIKNI